MKKSCSKTIYGNCSHFSKVGSFYIFRMKGGMRMLLKKH